jgi:hypothetical protein
VQRLGDGADLADKALEALVRICLASRAGLDRTWRAICTVVDRDGELGTVAVVSMLMFQLAVGTAGVKLISEHRTADAPAELCATGPCAVGTAASELSATAGSPVRRPLGGVPQLGTPAGSSHDGDDPQAVSNAAATSDVPDTPSGPSPDRELAPAPDPDPGPEAETHDETETDDEAPPTAVAVAQSLFDEVELPAPMEVFDLPLDPVALDLPTRRMPYEEFAERGPEMIERLPSLDVLQAHFPENPMTSDVEAQKEHILHLAEQVEVSVEGYRRLAVDMTRRTAFRSLPNYHDEIEPRMFVVHWTGMGYRNVDHFVRSMRPNRVQYFINRDARVFELFESDTNWPAHALGANDFAQGVEIETGHFDERTSPLFSYTPAQIEHTIYVAVDFLRRNDLPVDETTLVGHYAADLLFTNPYYDPHVGRFTQDRIRKFDPPQELMQVIVHEAQQLDAALDAQ